MFHAIGFSVPYTLQQLNPPKISIPSHYKEKLMKSFGVLLVSIPVTHSIVLYIIYEETVIRLDEIVPST